MKALALVVIVAAMACSHRIIRAFANKGEINAAMIGLVVATGIVTSTTFYFCVGVLFQD